MGALGDVGQSEDIALIAFEQRNRQPGLAVDAVDLLALAQIVQRLGGVFSGHAVGHAGTRAAAIESQDEPRLTLDAAMVHGTYAESP